jgi:hypothetical protein
MNTSWYTVDLGHEADGALVSRLHEAVIASGGAMTLSTHDVGGMEESISYEIVLPEGELEAVAETGMGLRLSGSEALVRKLFMQIRSEE